MQSPPANGGASIGASVKLLKHKHHSAPAPLPRAPAANPLAIEFYHQHLALCGDNVAMAWLVKSGVSHSDRLGCGNAGVVAVETTRDGLYQPAPGGRRAFIMPVYGPFRPPKVPIADPADAAPIDLLGWYSHRPGRWWRRRGVAIILGEWAVELGETYDEPVRVYRTPLDWLRAGGEGLVIVDWTEAYFRLAGLQLVASDVAHGEELQRRLRPPQPEGPRILVPRRRTAA